MSSHNRDSHRINFRSLIHEATRCVTHRIISISLIHEATQAHKRATHRMILGSLIREAITYPLVYLPRSSSTKATAEPLSNISNT